MSLVHQALRKAEQEKLRKTGRPLTTGPERILPPPEAITSRPAVTAAAASGPSLPAQATASPRGRGWWILGLAGLVVLTAVLAGLVLLQQGKHPGETSPPAETVAADATPAAAPAAIPESVAPVAVADPDDARFKLTGITQLPGGESAAVINGQLRSVDQYIDGAIIKKIEPDRVTLDVDGREIVKRLF